MTANWPTQLSKLATVTASGTITAGKHNSFNATAGALTATLPPLTTGAVATALAAGQVVRAKISKSKTDASTNAVTVTCAATDTFENGSATQPLTVPGEKVTLAAQTVPGGSGPVWVIEEHTAPRDTLDLRYLQLVGSFASLVSPAHYSFTGAATSPFLQIDNATGQSSIHLTQAAGFSGVYILGIGNDNGTAPGLLVSNKAAGPGVVIANNATITSATAYGLDVNQLSTIAPAVLLENNVADGAPVLQVLNNKTWTDATKDLVYIGDQVGPILHIKGLGGKSQFYRDVEVHDPSSGSARLLLAQADGGASADASYGWLEKLGVVLLGASGTTNQWYASRFHTGAYSGQFKIQGATITGGSDAATAAAATWHDAITVNQNGSVGFFGKSPVNQATSTPPNATDLASALTLVNALRAAIVNIGIAA